MAVGALVATHYGARYAQIAWSGAGILVPGAGRTAGSAGSRNPTIPELYGRASPSDATATWAPSSFVPQVGGVPCCLWRRHVARSAHAC